jgi:hypothetical protein
MTDVSPRLTHEIYTRKHAAEVAQRREDEQEVLARIDWHAFMVLDTIEFTAEDDGLDFPGLWYFIVML